MLRAFIEAGEHRPCLVWDNRYFVVFPRKLAHGIQRIELHDGDEFHLFPGRAAEQLDASKAWDAAVLDADEDLLLEQRLVFIGVAWDY